MVKKKKRYSLHENNTPHDKHDKAILALFVTLVIFATFFLINGIPTFSFLGYVTNGLSLEQTAYDPSELLKGSISLTVEPSDVLPANSTVTISISSNVSKCSTEYICQNGRAIQWHNNSAACELIERDPEGKCCLISGTNCTQIVLNKDFNTLDRWSKINPSFFSPDSIGVEEVIIGYDGENINFSNASFEISEPVSSNAPSNSSLSIKQNFGGRELRVSQLGGTVQSMQLKEWYCNPAQTCVFEVANCTGGTACIDGRCSSPTQENQNPLQQETGAVIAPITGEGSSQPGSCIDNDSSYGDLSKFVFGQCTDTYSSSLDACSGSTLLERACVSSGQCGTQIISCPSGTTCSAGRCVSINNGCTDSDNGTNYNQKGVCTDASGPYTDQCQSGTSTTPFTSLKWSVAWQHFTDAPCAFEVMVKGGPSQTPKILHYYYKIDSACTHAYPTTTEKYIEMTPPSESDLDNMNWKKENIDLYKNWTSTSTFGPSSASDNITEIQIAAYYKKTGEGGLQTIYSQKVWFDYITLTKYPGTTQITGCTQLGKKCCLTGTGFGKYYGEQLSCEGDKECWSSCTNSTVMTFQRFIAKSESPGKYNTTAAHCYANGGVDADLQDECDPWTTPLVGRGYTACLSNETSTCRNWETQNLYLINLSKLSIRAPSQNGTYLLSMRFEYDPVQGIKCGLDYNETCLIFERSAQFTVGTFSGCTPNWQTIENCSDCVDGMQCVTQQDSENCESPNTRQVTVPCGCSIIWGNCAWSVCDAGENQTNTCYDTTCNTGTSNVTETRACCIEQWQTSWGQCFNNEQTQILTDLHNCATTFHKPSTQTKSCGTDITKQWYFWTIIVVVLVAIFVVLLMTVLKKKSTMTSTSTSESGRGFQSKGIQRKASEYPELDQYITDASASGASKEEIRTKLVEAGWPDDAVNASFRALGM
jgi:hypothetical protein